MKENRELTLFVDEFRTPISGKTAAQGLFLAKVQSLKEDKNLVPCALGLVPFVEPSNPVPPLAEILKW